MGIKHLAILACALIVGQTASARERYQLQLNDQEMRGATTLQLKQLLLQQHRVNANRYELVGIRLIAKSQAGRGTAALRVGRWTSNAQRIQGSPQDWNRPGLNTFDQLDFSNNSRRDRGAWQVEFQGNVKVRRVVLIVERVGGGGGRGDDWDDGWDDDDRDNGGGLIRFQNVRCESHFNALNQCAVNGRIVVLRLLQQHSTSPCVEGRTYGTYERGVWVRGGCRATFQVGTRIR